MYVEKLKQTGKCRWEIEPFGEMRVPVVVYADSAIMHQIDDQVCAQAANVAKLPGIVAASYVMPDAHLGYGFPIGGVAAFDPERGGVVSAGGVGFDISCGVRAIGTELSLADLEKHKERLADLLARRIPAGVGSKGKVRLSRAEMDRMLEGGAAWAVEMGYGRKEDLARTEEKGKMAGAEPANVSEHAKERQTQQTGTLGSGNHYLEVQRVTKVYDKAIAKIYGLTDDSVVVSIHCGSRGLGHQIATDFLPRMVKSARIEGIELPEKQLACARINSKIGQEYLGAMRAGINCALANRQVLMHLVRRVFSEIFGPMELPLLYDVSHNTCKQEKHMVNGKMKELYVHRKGATRAFGPGEKSLGADIREAGQPVLIGGTMGTASFILAGTRENEPLSFGSCCHGAGRAMSRKQATKTWQGRDVVRHLATREILIRCSSMRGVAEEAPGAYKDVEAVVDATEKAKLAKKVVRLEPMICVKG